MVNRAGDQTMHHQAIAAAEHQEKLGKRPFRKNIQIDEKGFAEDLCGRRAKSLSSGVKRSISRTAICSTG